MILILFPLQCYSKLSNANYGKAIECLGKLESGNVYTIKNTLGYLGRWQFGAAALEDLGFLKKGCYRKYKNSMPTKCWTGKSHTYSKYGFLRVREAQDLAIKLNFELNYKRLMSKKVLTKHSSQIEIAQGLFVAHLLGANGAYDYFKKNINKSDGYGTKASDYSKAAKQCITGE